MRNFPASGLIVSLALVVAGTFFAPRANTQNSAVETGRTPVLVELFTSEGCSSCPPADVLLQKLEQQQPVPGAEIIALEEHVDYWNHDGWIDPYSSPEWTQRQEDYAALFKKDPYTPEIVVDGRTQCLGSNPREVGLEIQDAARNLKTEIAITAEQPDTKGSQRFTVSVGKLAGNTAHDNAEVWLAVTEDGLHSSVNQGENTGRELNHVATLRSLRKIGVADASGASVSFRGDSVVKFNSHWDLEHLRVTVFVQEKKSREVVGAASTKIKG